MVVGVDGLPLFYPNLWLTSKHRSRGAAFGTLLIYAGFLARLYSWAEHRGLALDQRLLSCEWLEKRELHALYDELSVKVNGVRSGAQKVLRKAGGTVEKFLGAKVSKVDLVANAGIKVRLQTVSSYLRWLGEEGITRVPFREKKNHEALLESMVDELLAMVPISHGHNKRQDKHYDRDGVRRLLEVVTPGHPENPFQSAEVQVRNCLLIHMLFTFGLRRGDLAAMKCKDIDLRAGVLAVARRPDDPEDPRGRYAPHQKTRARVMALELTEEIKRYRNKFRDRHDIALQHPYLLVSEQGGRPLSLAALEKVFQVLRENVSGLPEKLTPHYLRHAWNYEWSTVCKQKGIPGDEADQLAKYLMGWTMSSGMRERYNEAYIKEKANECSLEVQRRLWSQVQGVQGVFERLGIKRGDLTAGEDSV